MTLKFISEKTHPGLAPAGISEPTRYAHDMTADDDEHRAHLQRLAFGRTGTPAEKQRAQWCPRR